MNFLSIETSTSICSVALFKNKYLIQSEKTNIPKSHSKELGNMIQQLFEKSNLKIDFLDFIALSSGPGSFTGLRIGSSLAKGIAFALNIPLVMVPTLHSLASQIKSINNYSLGLFSHKNYLYVQDFKDAKPINNIELIEANNLKNKKLYGFSLDQLDITLDYIEVEPSAQNVGLLAIENYNKWLVKDLTKAKLNYITNLKIN